jgi:hypothetical protein
MDGICEVHCYEIRLKRPFRSVPKILAFAITCAHQNTARPGVASKLHVGVAVTNNDGAMQVQRVFSSGALQHAGFWLAAIAPVRGCVRAIVYGVEVRSRGFQFLGHQFVDRAYERLRKIAAADAGLIRYYNHGPPCFIQAANCIGDLRQDTKSADMIQVADFFGDGAITIEKNGWPKRVGVRQDAPR